MHVLQGKLHWFWRVKEELIVSMIKFVLLKSSKEEIWKLSVIVTTPELIRPLIKKVRFTFEPTPLL